MKLARWALCLLAPTLFAQSPRRDYVQAVVDSSLIRGVTATGSMRPTFDETYYLLTLDPTIYPFNQVKVGDVIIAWENIDGQVMLVCHTVWRVSSGGSVLLLKGVNNPRPDSAFVTQRDYAGLVVGWIRRDVELKPLGRPHFLLDVGGKR